MHEWHEWHIPDKLSFGMNDSHTGTMSKMIEICLNGGVDGASVHDFRLNGCT